MMKNTQGASGQTNQHGSGHSRTATQTDYHHGSTGGGGGGGGGRHHQRNHHDAVEVQPNGQRSKSTSHHHHGHHGQYHSNRDGSSLQHNSVGHHDARNAPQPRSHSHAKGVPQGTSSTNRESHHHAAPAASSTQQKSGNSASLATRSGHQANGTSSSSNNANAVGHYILGKALGEGTFGKVKLGTHVLTGEKVAVKVLEKSKIKDKKDVERISREIKILKQLHHPNVVQIYEIIETDKDLYLVMEFASGGELFELIVQNQKLKERTASKHLQELLAGVHYIHQLGICHRDLKPENLLIDFDGQLKIVDFGLSNMYEKGQTLKTACGSPCYAAPEMIAGNRYHGLKSDIWSCGVVLYAMLCGYLPFEDQKTSNLYKKIMNAEYSLPKFLSNDAKDILSKIFVTDPNKRIGIEGLKQHPWYRLYQPENQNYEYHTMARTVNDKLVMKMEASLGFSIESVQRAVENNKHNHLSATYYLLLKKYAQASYKSNQAHRSASVPARVDTRNPDYQYHKAQRNSTRPANENSDSKNRPVTSDPNMHHLSGSPGKSTSGTTTANSAAGKYGKYRNKAGGAIDAERLKAPVQDQLVLKNHRREQSANATAGRHNRNGDWGSVEDERRTESQVRAGLTDDYEIVISKVNNKGEPATQPAASGEESKTSGANGGREAKNSNLHQNLRANFASPSPDIGPHASRNRNNSLNQPSLKQSSINNQNSQNHNGGSSNAHKSQMVDAKSKPMEVNIQNMKQSFNQIQTPSQIHTRVSSMPKTSLPKPATYTHATISSTQRSAEKQKQSMNKSDRQASQPAGPSNQHASSHHRKTKSTVPEVQKQHSQQNPSGRESQNTGPLIDQKQLAAEKKNFSQTQKITNLSKSSGQQPRQQSITISANDHSKHHSIGGGGGGSTQNAKVSDLIGNLNMMSQQKTYFDQIAGKHGSAPTTTTGPSAYIPSSKHQSAEQAAGIEGNNVGQADTVVNVNKNGGSSGIFQSLTSVMQRPIIQDMNSQNLLKRLENGSSDNQLRQTFASRQSQQHKRKDDPSQLSMVQNDHRTQQSPPLQGDIPLNKRTTLQVDDPRNQYSRLSQISQGNSHFPNQPISKTPVTGYQTLDTMGDMSSHELKVPMNPDTDRGVSKSIFYGTQRIANLNQEIQRYSNDKISGNHHSKDFNKTQTVNMSHNHGYHRNSLNTQIERSSKNVTHRTESTSRQSATAQPKGTSASHSTRHQRQSTVVVSKKSGVADGMAKETINNSSTALINHSRQNGYSIPTQQVTQIPSSTQSSHHQTGVSKNSQQKFQSLKLSSAVKVTQHMMPQSTIEHQQQPQSTNQSMIASVKGNHANQQSQMASSGPKKVKEQPQKTRSQSVSGAQKSAQIYTPASHRKGGNGANQTNSLLASQASGAGAAASLTAHYRSSTASSTNKERRGSQPPQTQQQAQKHAQVNQSLMSNSTNVQQNPQPKQRSTSSTNYQSAFLVKSLDGRPEGQVSSQRTRQKSTRDNASMNTSLIQQLPQDRQFQSITHASGPNSSILAQQLEETIFNQSFSGTAAGASRYQGRSGTGSANYNKRNQQVASINELLNVAETLKQSHYSVRPRQSNNSGAQQVKESADVRQKQANGYATQQVHSSTSQQPTIMQTAHPSKGGGNQSKQNQPVVISDLGISFNQYAQPSQSTTNGQSELKAGLLLSQYQQQLQQQQAQQRAPSSGKQQQQSLTNAMKQITDGLMMRQHQQQQVQASGQSYHQGSSSGYQPQMHQSYLSDLFAKQASQIQQSSQQASKKQSSAGVNATNLFLNQQVSSNNPHNQTQPIGIKTALYSPSSRAKSSVTHQTLDASQDLLSNYQQRTPYSKVQQPQSLDPSPANHPQPVLYGHQLKQSMNQTQPAQSFLNHSGYQGSHQQQQLFYGHQPQNFQHMSSGGKDYSHGQQINLLQHHQNTIQQLSANQAAHTPQSSSTMTNNFMPPQQLSVSMHHFNQMAQSVPQPQKPPSVPAPSTAYQQLLAQQLHQSQHQQAHLNFYPGQQQHM